MGVRAMTSLLHSQAISSCRTLRVLPLLSAGRRFAARVRNSTRQHIQPAKRHGCRGRRRCARSLAVARSPRTVVRLL